MGKDAQQTLGEIEETREDLARRVAVRAARAKVEAGEIGRKLAIGAAALAGLLVIGLIAKRRVR
jgi:hypothetical protein